MRVVYSDESGVGSVEKEPLSIVTAIVVDLDHSWPAVETKLREIVNDAPTNLLHKQEELRGTLLYSAIRKDIPERPMAREILTRVLELTVTDGIQICYGAVDRKGWDEYAIHTRTTPSGESHQITAHDRAFDACAAHVDRFAAAIDEHILWIADHSDPNREMSTKAGLRWIESLKAGGWDPLGFKYVGRDYDRVRIADSIYFGHSRESLALQLADVCCSTVTLNLLEKFYGWRPIVQPFYEIIFPSLLNDTRPEYSHPPK